MAQKKNNSLFVSSNGINGNEELINLIASKEVKNILLSLNSCVGRVYVGQDFNKFIENTDKKTKANISKIIKSVSTVLWQYSEELRDEKQA